MGKYVENNLSKNEVIVKKAKRSPIGLFWTWVGAIVFCWALLIPVFKAIKATVIYCHENITLTNKRIIGRLGIINTKSLDAPLNKIQNVTVIQKLGGKIFNYGYVAIFTAVGEYKFSHISSPDAFKGMIMAQIDQYEEDHIKAQASEMARAMSGVLNQNQNQGASEE